MHKYAVIEFCGGFLVLNLGGKHAGGPRLRPLVRVYTTTI